MRQYTYVSPTPLALVTCLLDKKTDAISIWESDGPSRQILGLNLTWAIGFSNQISSCRILQYRTIHKIRRPIHSSNRKAKNLKLGIRSRKNQPDFDVTMWWSRVLMYRSHRRRARYRVLFFSELTEVSSTGIDVVPHLPKCPVPVLMYRTYRSVRYQYWGCTELTEVCGTGMKVCTGTGGTGIDDVPNLMKCPVPVLMSYRIYRSIQYRYWCGTELTEVSGSGIDDVPDLPKCPVPVLYRIYRSIQYRYRCGTELICVCLLIMISPKQMKTKVKKKLTQSTINKSFLYLLPSWTLLVYIFPLITCCILCTW